MSEEKRNELRELGLGRVFLSVPLFIKAVMTEEAKAAAGTCNASFYYSESQPMHSESSYATH
jgi:hypothetical protein